MAFRTAARIGVAEALAKADPVLLEPIQSVEIAAPSDCLSRITAIVSGGADRSSALTRAPTGTAGTCSTP